MSRLADVYRKEKKAGGGVVSALKKRTAEKYDPRQFFDQKGMLAAVLPSLFKAYKATGTTDIKHQKLENLNEKTERVADNTKSLMNITGLIAKNTSVLPAMLRDTNIMRQNMVIIAKSMKLNASDTTDQYFKDAKEQENIIEARRIKDTSPTPIATAATPDKSSGASLLGIGMLLAAVAGGITAYFSNDEFRAKMDEMFMVIKDSIITPAWTFIKDQVTLGLKGTLDSIGEIWNEHWGKITVGLLAITALMNPIDTVSKGLSGIAYAIGAFGSKGTLMAALGSVMSIAGPLAALAGLYVGWKNTDYSKSWASGDTGGSMEPVDQQGNPIEVERTPEQIAAEQAKLDSLRSGGTGFPALDDLLYYDPDKKKGPEPIKVIQRPPEPLKSTPTPEPTPTPVGPKKEETGLMKSIEKQLGKLGPKEAAASTLDEQESTKPTKVYSGKGADLLNKILDQEGVTDKALRARIFALAQHESSLDPNRPGPLIKSGMHSGDRARGLLQIMPKTAAEVGFTREQVESDPEKAAIAGVKYFLKNYNRFGNLDAATVAHHAGPASQAVKSFLATGSAGASADMNQSTDNYLASIRAKDGGSLSTNVASNQTQADKLNTQAPTPKPGKLDNLALKMFQRMWANDGDSLNMGSVDNLNKAKGEGQTNIVVQNQPKQPQQAIQNNISNNPISPVVDTDFMAILMGKTMWGSPTSAV